MKSEVLKMETAALIGKSFKVHGYGKQEGSPVLTGKLVALDARHATLRFLDAADKTKTVDLPFRLTDGMCKGSQPDGGVKLSAEDLKNLAGKPAAKPAKKTPAEGAEKPAETPESKPEPKARAEKESIVIPATDWFPMERTRIGGKPPVAKEGQVRLRISSRGFGALLKMPQFQHLEGDSTAKTAFVKQWRDFTDKRWIFVYLGPNAASYLWSILGVVFSQEGAPRRALKTIMADLKSAMPKTLKGDPIAEAAVSKPAVEKADKKTKTEKAAPVEEEVVEEEEVENPDSEDEDVEEEVLDDEDGDIEEVEEG